MKTGKQRILIADASPTCHAVLRREFDPTRFDLHEAYDGEEAIRVAKAIRPVIATVSLELPKRNGIEVCRALTSDKPTQDTTIVMITARDSAEERATAFAAGAARFLGKSFQMGELASYVEEIVEARSHLVGTRILITDDSARIRRMIAKVLESKGATVHEANNGLEGLAILEAHAIDIVLTDFEMPELDGIGFVRAMRRKLGYAATPVLFLSGSDDRRTLVRALNAGANDYMRKPFEAMELIARIGSFARMASLTRQLKAMATTDELTGLFNRREAFGRFDEFFASVERYGQDLACIMLDIDHFKTFNDAYGHAVGDTVLREVASVLKENVRASDLVSRIGGEEFLVICPQCDCDAAAACAEKLRLAIENHVVDSERGQLKVTVSLGVAQRTQGSTDVNSILKDADEALYVSKGTGRNTVTVADTLPATAAVSV